MQKARQAMVDQIQRYGVTDERVLAAMRKVRREVFFPDTEMALPVIAYGDFPFPIGWRATISQPYIVAYMTARLALRPGERVLEIGTGSGYQAAVLAAMGVQVWSLEVVPELAEHAQHVLAAEGFEGVNVRCATGVEGWKDVAPFDAILVTCAAEVVPDELVNQLVVGGRMIIPVGPPMEAQKLVMVRRQEDKSTYEDDLAVRFVSMV
jgi:protein-L-isoaspartate(D-aspartate) O-methyltransferase